MIVLKSDILYIFLRIVLKSDILYIFLRILKCCQKCSLACSFWNLNSHLRTRSERVLFLTPAPWQIIALLPPYVIITAMMSKGSVQPDLYKRMELS